MLALIVHMRPVSLYLCDIGLAIAASFMGSDTLGATTTLVCLSDPCYPFRIELSYYANLFFDRNQRKGCIDPRNTT